MKYGEKPAGVKFLRYRVTHPEQGSVELVALSSENAIQNACDTWGISWGLNAAECTPEKLGEAAKSFCKKCGCQVFLARDGLCNRCRMIDAANRREAGRFREMLPKKSRREWA